VSGAAKKLSVEQEGAPLDRELGLANSFDDPGIEALLAAGEPTLLEEATEAVKDLVAEANHQPSVLVGEEASVSVESLLFPLVLANVPFDQLADSILETFVRGFGAQAGSILELDSAKGEFFFRSTKGGGDPNQLKIFRVPMGQGIVGQVAHSREAVLLSDEEADAKQLRAISMTTGLETRTCLAAPILVSGQLYGVLELFNRLDGGLFTPMDLVHVRSATQAAGKVFEVRFLLAELARRMKG
jgi:transcriptional regulator with GAF, ATPase, and Fis domain